VDGGSRGEHHSPKQVWHAAREYLTHWMVAGLIVAATGVAPEHWMAHLVQDLNIPADALHLWAAEIDLRWVLLAAGLTLVVGDIAWRRTLPAPVAGPVPAGAVLALRDKPSIAVLPFDNLSGDPEQEYFSDGMAEDIGTQLSRSHALFVIVRNSSLTYKGRAVDVKQVGRELGVRYVLEGSVFRAAERLRISAQLVEAETGNHIWAERYDRALADVFAVQDEISDAVATAIGPAVADAEMHRAMRRRTKKHAACSSVPSSWIRCLPPPTPDCHSPISGRALFTRPCRWTRRHGRSPALHRPDGRRPPCLGRLRTAEPA